MRTSSLECMCTCGVCGCSQDFYVGHDIVFYLAQKYDFSKQKVIFPSLSLLYFSIGHIETHTDADTQTSTHSHTPTDRLTHTLARTHTLTRIHPSKQALEVGNEMIKRHYFHSVGRDTSLYDDEYHFYR